MERIRISGPAGSAPAEPLGLRAMVRRFRRHDESAPALPPGYRPLDVTGPPGSGFAIIGIRREAPATR